MRYYSACSNSNNNNGWFDVSIFRHRLILKEVTFNLTDLVTVFKSGGKYNAKCNGHFFLIRSHTIKYAAVR